MSWDGERRGLAVFKAEPMTAAALISYLAQCPGDMRVYVGDMDYAEARPLRPAAELRTTFEDVDGRRAAVLVVTAASDRARTPAPASALEDLPPLKPPAPGARRRFLAKRMVEGKQLQVLELEDELEARQTFDRWAREAKAWAQKRPAAPAPMSSRFGWATLPRSSSAAPWASPVQRER